MIPQKLKSFKSGVWRMDFVVTAWGVKAALLSSGVAVDSSVSFARW